MASASGSPWLARSSPVPGWSSSTRRPSHLDAASETLIRDAVERLARDRAVLIVSHRLRLVSIADVVAVIDRGRVVESGAPAELAARDGPYRRLLAADDAGQPS